MTITTNEGITITLTEKQLADIKAQTIEVAPKFYEPTSVGKNWCLNGAGDICYSINWTKEYEKSQIKVGNYYKTKEEAEHQVEVLKAKQRLKKAIFKLNGYNRGFIALENNYCITAIQKGPNQFTLFTDYSCNYKHYPSWMYMKDLSSCDELEKAHKDDLLLVLGE